MPATAEQLAVRNNIDGYNLVTAPPGSGKTFTIIQCVLGLLSSPDSRIIAVTFTNAAAEEMKSRVGKEIKGNNRKQIFIATFHSILISQARQAGFGSHLRLLVGNELQPYMQQIVGHYNEKRESDAKKEGKKIPRKLKWIEASEIITTRDCQLSNMITDVEFIYEGEGFYELYCETMKSMGVWSMNMLCRETTNAIVEGKIPPIRATHIIVDEFQDVDEIQLAWINEQGKYGSKITVVGDDDQSIFSFRESLGYQGMVRFKERFQAQTYALSTCFRCAPEILSPAVTLIQNNIKRMPKVIVSGSQAKGTVGLVCYGDERTELEQIVAGAIASEGKSRAVLARTNLHLDTIESLLRERKVEYKRLNGVSIWEKPIMQLWVKFLFTILRADSSQFLTDVLVFIGESAENVREITKMCGKLGFHHMQYDDWAWEFATQGLYNLCIQQCYKGGMIEDSVIDGVIDDCCDYLDKLNRNDAMVKFAKVLKAVLSNLGPGTFNDRIEKIMEYQSMRKTKDVDSDVVTLTTFHGAKGLEFDWVWLMGVGKMEDESAVAVEEERRTLYVAITRAKELLTVSWVGAGAQSQLLEEAFGEGTVSLANGERY